MSVCQFKVKATDLDFHRNLVFFVASFDDIHLHLVVNCCLHSIVTALHLLVQVSGRMRAIESKLNDIHSSGAF